MGNAVEKGPDIKVQHPVLFPTTPTGHSQSVMGGTPGTIAVTVGMEDRFKHFFQQPGGRGLSNPVGHIGHTLKL